MTKSSLRSDEIAEAEGGFDFIHEVDFICKADFILAQARILLIGLSLFFVAEGHCGRNIYGGKMGQLIHKDFEGPCVLYLYAEE